MLFPQPRPQCAFSYVRVRFYFLLPLFFFLAGSISHLLTAALNFHVFFPRNSSPLFSITCSSSLLSLLPLITRCYPCYPLLLLLPLFTPCYPCDLLLPLLPVVTPCYTLLPRVTLVTLCYHLILLLPFVTLVTPCYRSYPR